ncbi:nucleotidyltransferase [Thermotoga sp.]|uniref:nucleotidyltransferase n=1 Tax=Thermotoga sp. TaxID=28240 RepID=UPI0025DDB475|nr:nucleotidyltransferase [Thermotoga sp.]MCD6551041.1 nucleotidyltransferase [Thermotoga sp.]
MKVLGVIVEYNPFHNGHLYHLSLAKEIVEPEYTIAVMSGNFCQRGEPAVIDKFARTEIALRMGVDVVLELPTVFATQDAGGFAFGAVSLLDATGVVTDVVFGSESNDIDFLWQVAKILFEQPEEYRVSLHEELKKGHSFPNARKFALMKYFSFKGWNERNILRLEKSNDILGVEYLHSALRIGSPIRFHTIKRVGAEEKDVSFKGRFSSATAIRNLLREKRWNEARESLPEASYEVLMREFKEGRGPVFLEHIGDFMLAFFRLKDREYFEKIHGFSEGLEKRFQVCSRRTGSYRDFLECVKTKRFTFSRIRRLCLFSVLEMSKKFVEKSNVRGPQYLRVLGFTEKGREILAVMRKKAKLPIVTNMSLYRKILKRTELPVDKNLFIEQLQLDVKSTNFYSMFFPSKEQRCGERDFAIHPVFLRAET